MSRRAFICGLSGPDLTLAERDFIASMRPAGIILFARNVQNPDRVRRLIEGVRRAAGGQILVLVDQEGGRVQRLSAPHWPRYPAASAFAQLGAKSAPRALEAARLCARMMAQDLARARLQCHMRAGARCARARSRQHHRRPRL